MSTVNVEDYAIRMRSGCAYQKGTECYRGKQRKIIGYKEYYNTKMGDFEREEWIKITRDAIESAGESDLLEKIKNHCRNNCAWLKNEAQIEEYAMECLTSRAYRHWDEFKELELVAGNISV